MQKKSIPSVSKETNNPTKHNDRPASSPEQIISRSPVLTPAHILQMQRSIGNRQVSSIIQRYIRIGTDTEHQNFDNPVEVRELALEAGASNTAAKLLASLSKKSEPYLFGNWEQAIARVESVSEYISEFSGLQDEVREIRETAEMDGGTKTTIKSLSAEFMERINQLLVGEEVAPESIHAVTQQIREELVRIQTRMFTLGEDRQPLMENSKQSMSAKKYGYQMTKFHNISGIREGGLDPDFGSSDRGSCAMCTEDQLAGSLQTSKNKVAFGTQPATFGPYINQATDRRQMIEGSPRALKPVMLRFRIQQAVGEFNDMTGTFDNTGSDFMDLSALNTDQKIEPEHIEVLTPEGWVPIGSFELESEALELREGDENAREGMTWTGTPIVMTYNELKEAEKKGYFNQLLNSFYEDRFQAISELKERRDSVSFSNSGFEFTFRGSTMQSSGDPNSWEYAFTVDGTGELPKWIVSMHKNYMKNYYNKVKGLIDEYEEARSG